MKTLLICLSVLISASSLHAQPISLTGTDYTQDFSTLSNTAGSTTNSLALSGWAMTETGGGARDNEQYAVDVGGSNTGDTYSYGALASTERAFGNLRAGTLISTIGASFTNNTGSAITTIAINYTGEEWRLGTAARTDRLDFQYSLNATDLVTGTWTDVNALDFTTPDIATVGAKNGNVAANRTALSTMITGLSIPNGATFWIRWLDVDASGADDGLSIDDFTLSTSIIVTPVTLLNFSAADDDQNVKIKWTTAQEFNSRKFNIERMQEEENVWTLIGSIPARGQSNILTYYEFIDRQPPAGKVFYRLNSIDLDDKNYFSPILSLRLSGDLSFAIYPNPAGPLLTIKTGNHGDGQVKIFNPAGQLVLTHLLTSTTTDINVSRLKAGLYFIYLSDEKKGLRFLKN